MNLRDLGARCDTSNPPPGCVLTEPLAPHLPNLTDYSSVVQALWFDSGPADNPTARSYVFYFFKGAIDEQRRPDEILTFKVRLDNPFKVYIVDKYLGGTAFGAISAPALAHRHLWRPGLLSQERKQELGALLTSSTKKAESEEKKGRPIAASEVLTDAVKKATSATAELWDKYGETITARVLQVANEITKYGKRQIATDEKYKENIIDLLWKTLPLPVRLLGRKRLGWDAFLLGLRDKMFVIEGDDVRARHDAKEQIAMAIRSIRERHALPDAPHEEDKEYPVSTAVDGGNTVREEGITLKKVCVNRDCAEEISDDSVFCEYCGTKQEKLRGTHCANSDCGRELAEYTRFCIFCGTPQVESLVPADPLTPEEKDLFAADYVVDKERSKEVAADVEVGKIFDRESVERREVDSMVAEIQSSASSSGPPPSDATATDQWLVKSFREVTNRMLDQIAMPWNQTVEKALADLARIDSEVNTEVEADVRALDEISQRFSGLKLASPPEALKARTEKYSKHSPQSGLSGDQILQKARSSQRAAYEAAKALPVIGMDLNKLCISKVRSMGLWVFVPAWVIVGAITQSWSVGFFIALLPAIGIPFSKAKQIFNSAENRWATLVEAIALKHYWLRQMKEAEQQVVWEVLTSLVKEKEPIAKMLKQMVAQIHEIGGYKCAPTSDSALWKQWAPGNGRAGVVRVGELRVKVRDLPANYGNIGVGTEIVKGITLPILASLTNGRSIYLWINNHNLMRHGYDIAQSMVFRILASTPPGKVLFTFIDPIGQGQNAAGFLSLADYDDSLVNSKAWTDPRQIERKLTDLTEHMETVIQKYLRTDYATIDDYNTAAGEIAEAYRVVVVFDFPDSITEGAARQLERIVQNGGRCGVYAIVVHDVSKKPTYGVNEENIAKHSLTFQEKNGSFLWDNYGHGPLQDMVSLDLDEAAPEGLVKSVVKAIGEKAKDALKVEVPYKKLLQLSGIDGSDVWTDNTDNGIRIPLGPGSARKPRYLELGVGLSVHALVIGRPGSGKSNLMHVVITTAARLYSPDDLQLYLIDFKEGVEFKPYAEAALPHARVIAIKSEREFGLSVLRGLDDELKRRGEQFRAIGVSLLGEYREKTKKKMPRILLVVDEFQELFVKQDNIADEVALLFDRIVRQGRAFGMHVLLGSQTLAGYSLPRATLNLITVRIALQSSEADSRMILADDNTAARLLSRPGEGIYNASSGLVEGNNLFQVALFDDSDRQEVMGMVNNRLREVRAKGGLPIAQFPPPLVFEGHEPAVLETSAPIMTLLSAPGWPDRKRAIELWLGEPIAIKPPTAMKVSKRSGSHLLVITKNEQEAVGVLTAAIISLVAQIAPGNCEIPVLDLTTADAEWADVPEHLEKLFGSHRVNVLDRRGLQEVLERFSAIIKDRTEGGQPVDSAHYLVLLGMHRARDLRQDQISSFGLSLDGDSKPSLSSHLATILRDGPECGVHVLAWCDSYANLDRMLDNRLIAEFGVRVVGQMTNTDSSRLIDDEAAAHLDRPHRLIKYDEEHVGVLETFRPYALPGLEWLERVGAVVTKRNR